jgi:anthranilate phosphoribosyltransferase
MKPASLEGLAAIDPEGSATLIRGVLSGNLRGVARDLVIANAASALFVAGAAANLLDATKLAGNSIDSGAAARKLEQLVKATN